MEKIQINWNKNPIEMKLFLSFLTVPVERSTNHLGSCNGWTLLFNTEHQLTIGGGIVSGVEYLDNIQYKIKLTNGYNNYVNPFYLYDIINNEGKAFFCEYYKDEINDVLVKQKESVERAKSKLKDEKHLLFEIELAYKYLTP